MHPPLAFIGNLGPIEIIVILVIGLLIFGQRLPEVGRSLGRGLMEFKRGLSGVRDQVEDLDREADARVDDELERRRERLPAGEGDEGRPQEPLRAEDVFPMHGQEGDERETGGSGDAEPPDDADPRTAHPSSWREPGHADAGDDADPRTGHPSSWRGSDEPEGERERAARSPEPGQSTDDAPPADRT